MPFEPGKSGNPGGRAKVLLPDGRSLADVAREHTVEAMETIIAAMRAEGAGWNVRRAAAEAVLDRGWGRPKQEIDAQVEINDLASVIASRRQRVDALNDAETLQ